MFGMEQYYIGHAVEGMQTATGFNIEGDVFSTPSHAVYLKKRWEDEWTAATWVKCNWAEWCLAPNMPQAEIEWRYGWKLNQETGVWYQEMPFAASYSTEPWSGESTDIPVRQNDLWRYVKIVIDGFDTGVDDLVWHGILGSVTIDDCGYLWRVDEEHPTGHYVRTGKQMIVCNGMEKMLQDTVMVNSRLWDDDSAAEIKIRRGLTFNAPLSDYRPSGNRSLTKHDGAYLFSNYARDDEAFWNLDHIVEYLVEKNPPIAFDGEQKVGWTISDNSLGLLGAGIYRPVVETEGRNVKEILDQIVNRKRLFSYHVVVNDDGDCEVVIDSLTHKTLAMGSELVALANPYPRRINLDLEIAESIIYVSHHEPVDRVRVRGAKARVMFTASFEDSNLVAGWTTTQEEAYEAGATATAAYLALDSGEIAEMQRMNARVRGKESLKEVYAFFKLPDDWDGLAADGLGGTQTSVLTITGPASWVDNYLSDDPACSELFRREAFMCQRLPIKAGYDYTVNFGAGFKITPTETDEIPHLERKPFIIIQDNNEKYIEVDTLGLAASVDADEEDQSYRWTGIVTVPDRERGFYLNVVGEPQHIIAKANFSRPTPANDPDAEADAEPTESQMWTWQTMLATIAIEVGARCEAAYPPSAETRGLDHVRELVIDAGEEFKLDWCHPYTVVGITDGGALETNSTGGYINDDRKKLQERAALAWSWYSVPRKSIKITTNRIGSLIPLGAMVRQLGVINPFEMNSVVSSIKVDIPSGTIQGKQKPAKMTVTTDYVHTIDVF